MKRYILFSLLLTIFGCIDDGGNYDYAPTRELQVIEMKSTNILTVGESVILSPKAIVKKDPLKIQIEGVKFEWLINYKVVAETETFTFTAESDGDYYGQLRMTDPLTGAISLFDFSITVKSPFETGYAILSEENGKAQLSFIRAKWLGQPDTIIYEGEYKDIYKQLNEGEDLQGLPISISEHWKYDNGLQNGELTLLTGNESEVYAQELNGTSLKRETYIQQEFENGMPAGCRPKQIIHTDWDSFLLDESGDVYIRRSNSLEGFHTGFFSDKIKLWNGRKFERLIFTNYSISNVIFGLERNPETGKNNWVGIYSDYWRADNNLQELAITGEHSEDFYDFEDEILFTDTRNDVNWSGDLSIVYKSKAGEYFLHCINIDRVSRSACRIGESIKINLGKELKITGVNGMCTNKKNNYTYLCDDHTIYWVENYYSEDYGEMKTFEKKISTIATNTRYNGNYGKQLVSMAIAFEDGSVEIWEIKPNATAFLGRVFTSEHSYGKIKQVLGKIGNSGYFFE
ncbi:MAG: PKD-like family lipoprotein [Odoribacter sp.]